MYHSWTLYNHLTIPSGSSSESREQRAQEAQTNHPVVFLLLICNQSNYAVSNPCSIAWETCSSPCHLHPFSSYLFVSQLTPWSKARFSQYFPPLMKPKGCYCVHRRLHIAHWHVQICYLIKINFIIKLPLTLQSPKSFISFRFLD
jgi:hypothetical protein